MTPAMPSMPTPQTHSAISRHKNCAVNAKTRPFSTLAPSFSAKFAKKRRRLFPVTETRSNILSRESNPFRKCIATSRQFDPKRYPVDTLPAAATVACSERNRQPSRPIVDEIHRVLANMRIPRPWRDPLAAGRLLLLSTFADSIRRPTAATAAPQPPASPPMPPQSPMSISIGRSTICHVCSPLVKAPISCVCSAPRITAPIFTSVVFLLECSKPQQPIVRFQANLPRQPDSSSRPDRRKRRYRQAQGRKR